MQIAPQIQPPAAEPYDCTPCDEPTFASWLLEFQMRVVTTYPACEVIGDREKFALHRVSPEKPTTAARITIAQNTLVEHRLDGLSTSELQEKALAIYCAVAWKN
jgi:hypothetical protein